MDTKPAISSEAHGYTGAPAGQASRNSRSHSLQAFFRDRSPILVVTIVTVFAIALAAAVATEQGVIAPKDLLRAVLFMGGDRPVLDGPYLAGLATLKVKLTDPAQTVPVDVWYPAEAPAASFATALARWRSWLSYPMGPSALSNAPVATARPKYPLIVYFPLWFGERRQATFTPANLASHGFIVATIDDIVHSAPLRGDEEKARISDIPTSSVLDFDKYRPTAALRAAVAAREASKIISALGDATPFGKRLDLDRVGAIGFSFGGATAAQLSRTDRRIKAVVNFDGSVYGDAEHFGVDVPYLMFFSDIKYPTEYELTRAAAHVQIDALLDKEAIEHQIMQAERPNNWSYVVKHTVHEDFCDKLVKPSLVTAFQYRPIDRTKTWSELNKYVVAFSNRFLLGSPEPLIGTAPYPEIRPFLEALAPPLGQTGKPGG